MGFGKKEEIYSIFKDQDIGVESLKLQESRTRSRFSLMNPSFFKPAVTLGFPEHSLSMFRSLNALKRSRIDEFVSSPSSHQ